MACGREISTVPYYASGRGEKSTVVIVYRKPYSQPSVSSNKGVADRANAKRDQSGIVKQVRERGGEEPLDLLGNKAIRRGVGEEDGSR